MARSLNTFIENSDAKGYANLVTAQRAIDGAGASSEDAVSFVIVQRQKDGRFFPVAINSMMPIYFAERNIIAWS